MGLLPIYEVITDIPIGRASWFDDKKTIMVVELQKQWQWEDAEKVIPILRDTVLSQPHDVYTVYYYQLSGISLLPKGVKLFNLRKLVSYNPPNEQLVIFVRTDSLLRSLLTVLSKTYGLRHIVKKYRYVDKWDDALQEIEKHKQAKQSAENS